MASNTSVESLPYISSNELQSDANVVTIRAQQCTRKPYQAARKSDINKVGQSIFYDCVDLSPEKQDFMKPEQSDTDEESMSQSFFKISFPLHTISRV